MDNHRDNQHYWGQCHNFLFFLAYSNESFTVCSIVWRSACTKVTISTHLLACATIFTWLWQARIFFVNKIINIFFSLQISFQTNILLISQYSPEYPSGQTHLNPKRLVEFTVVFWQVAPFRHRNVLLPHVNGAPICIWIIIITHWQFLEYFTKFKISCVLGSYRDKYFNQSNIYCYLK